jgi:pimeloyl-ACP methyl ester carboxylesterase
MRLSSQRLLWSASKPMPGIRQPLTRGADLEQFFRQVYKPYGWLSDAQWRRLTETSSRRLPNGKVDAALRPRHGQAVHQPSEGLRHLGALRHAGDPVLCLRGAESDLVLPSATQAMQTRGPGAKGRARIVEVAGCGHAPALNVPGQLDLIASFLQDHP